MLNQKWYEDTTIITLEQKKEKIKKNILELKNIFEIEDEINYISIVNEGSHLIVFFHNLDFYGTQIKIKFKEKTFDSLNIIEELPFYTKNIENEFFDLLNKIENDIFNKTNDNILNWFIKIFEETDNIKYKNIYLNIDNRLEIYDLENKKFIEEDEIFE